ncbi:MAG: eukaryotic-like serine/threonine-protein kinase, partial [Candidatus Hydrogenedentes bacterium]|nr:eukaryotic-like serine/threonine-protein kinase [Candidatus Hydrogenedentota bacterium]
SLEAGAEAGMTPDKGVVRVSASSIEAIEKTGEVALVNLVFRIGADNDGPVPVSLLSFSLSDQYGFSPRFDAPKAPIIGPKIVPPYIVPDVVGLTQAAAEAAINGIGLSVGTVTQQSSATVAAGNVISQDPVAGTSVEVTTLVNLVVSTGAPVTMYTLSVVLDGRGVGSVELNPGGGQYAAGTVVTLTATAADGSHFEGWGDALGNANPVTVTVNANTTVTAEFDKNGIICNRASISTGGANPGDLLLLGLVCALLLFAGKKSAVTARVEAN